MINIYNYLMSYAAKKNCPEVVEKMLEKGADSYNSAIYWAIKNKNMQIFNLLIGKIQSCTITELIYKTIDLNKINQINHHLQ